VVGIAFFTGRVGVGGMVGDGGLPLAHNPVIGSGSEPSAHCAKEFSCRDGTNIRVIIRTVRVEAKICLCLVSISKNLLGIFYNYYFTINTLRSMFVMGWDLFDPLLKLIFELI
jgi:hypothetical protein